MCNFKTLCKRKFKVSSVLTLGTLNLDDSNYVFVRSIIYWGICLHCDLHRSIVSCLCGDKMSKYPNIKTIRSHYFYSISNLCVSSAYSRAKIFINNKNIYVCVFWVVVVVAVHLAHFNFVFGMCVCVFYNNYTVC